MKVTLFTISDYINDRGQGLGFEPPVKFISISKSIIQSHINALRPSEKRAQTYQGKKAERGVYHIKRQQEDNKKKKRNHSMKIGMATIGPGIPRGFKEDRHHLDSVLAKGSGSKPECKSPWGFDVGRLRLLEPLSRLSLDCSRELASEEGPLEKFRL